MDFFENKSNINKVIFLVCSVIVCFVLIRLGSGNDNDDISYLSEDKSSEKYDKDGNSNSEYIMVHISGEVKNEGVYKIKSDSRMVDIVELAGGLTSQADKNRINLSSKLKDEQRIIIPSLSQENLETPSVNKEVLNTDKININTAGIEELKSLPGIGEKTAQKIIDYREKNPFTKIEDIMLVPGFGQKKFESLKEYIKVDG